MPAGFKIAEAYVAVVPRDQDFQARLRELVDVGSEGVTADVALGLTKDAPEQLRGDLDAALHLVTEGLTADVGLGLKNDAVEELDADVKAGVELVEENNKVKVKVDAKAAQQAGQGAGMGILIGLAAALGPGVLTTAVLAGAPLMITALGAFFAAQSPAVKAALSPLEADVKTVMTDATAPLVPAASLALSQFDSLFASEVPRLSGYFRQAQPDLLIFTGGVESFVRNILPGFDSAMSSSEVATKGLATGLGLAGDGVSHLIEGLSGGAQGGAQGFVATMRLVDDLLGILGTDIGRIAQAAGPVLQKLEPPLAAAAKDLGGITTSTVVTGLNVVNSILSALPVGVVRAIADATAAWLVASKVYGIVSAAGPAMASAATKIGLLSEAEVTAAGGADKMGASLGKGLGIISLVVTGAGLLGDKLGQMAGVGDHTAQNVDKLTGVLLDAANGVNGAQHNIVDFVDAMAVMGDVSGGKASAGMQSLDQALTKLYQTNPEQAAYEFNEVSQALNAQGKSAAQVAAYFPNYKQAVDDATLSQKLAAQSGNDVSQTLDIEQQKLNLVESAYTAATTAASQFKSEEDALYGKYADYSAAQAHLTEEIAKASGQLTHGKNAIDLNTDAGAKNFTVLKGLYDANDQLAQALIKQGGSQEQATASIQKGAQAIDDLAKKSGFTDKQIQQLNVDLYGVPTVKEITFQANISPALTALNGLIQKIDSSSGTVQIYGAGGGKALGANADGGSVQAGDYSLVGERGPEIVQFGRAGMVIPNEAIRKVSGDTSLAKGSGLGGVTIQNLTIQMEGIVDFTDPNSMSTAARRMAVNLQNALNQVQRGRTGTRY